MSISSHPVFIIDSDIDIDKHFKEPEKNLKKDGKRIFQLFNDVRYDPGSNLFIISGGREMENYFPLESIQFAIKAICKNITEEEMNKINFDDNWKQSEKYYEMLSRKFQDAGIGSITEKGFQAKGISKWGYRNKTQVVQTALEYPQLSLDIIKYNGKEHIDSLVKFIKKWQV